MCVRDCSRVILSFAPLLMPLLLCWIYHLCRRQLFGELVKWIALREANFVFLRFLSMLRVCSMLCLCKQVTGKKCYDVSISSACRWRTVTHIPRTRWHSTKQEWLECFHNVTKYKKRFMAMSKNRRNPQTHAFKCPKITANIGNIVSSNLITWVHQIHVLSMLRVCATHWIWSTRSKSIEQNQ